MTGTFTLVTTDGIKLVVDRWLPAGAPRAVVQIAHGACEHAGRYARLANELTGAGFAVYADDHRGHGRTAGSVDRFGVCGPDAFWGMVRDERDLTDHIAAAHPGIPVVLLGHSMGSFMAQGYIQRYGDRLAGVVLTGTAGSLSPAAVGVREQLEEAVATEGRDVPSTVYAAMFAQMNEPFADPPPPGGLTGYEWLSRDHDEVRKYADDPWCGLPFSNGFALDLATARPEIWTDAAERRIPTTLPVLITAGDCDPVGRQGESVRELTARYRALSLDVTEVLYPGARHELFNELNRDEVVQDLLAWLDRILPPA